MLESGVGEIRLNWVYDCNLKLGLKRLYARRR